MNATPRAADLPSPLRQKLAGAQSQMIELEQQHDRLKENNAELLEALQLFVRWATDETIPTREAMEQACAAITNATSQLTSERAEIWQACLTIFSSSSRHRNKFDTET